ncbi:MULTISPECIES: 3'-5' exonuclease [unclassified Endozoicomonas]|uniref:3'-5' exonuclease n=1 Tax=unclassified Endozoicomonas TaxID=2644528 RepID=UPI00214730DA|nr:MULTISPECIES: 3'-5' exonuclease [unclassified Endozoicomonas]
MDWLVPRQELTENQMNAVDASCDCHLLFIGPPGSGKTQILLHRANDLAHINNVSKEKFCIFIFTKVLSKYIRSAASILGIPLDSITTFDSWVYHFYKKSVSSTVPRKNKKTDYDGIRKGVLDYLNQNKDAPVFDFVMVDEGQDLDETAYKILLLISEHITVCADYRQQIYPYGAVEGEIACYLGLDTAKINLLDALRCSPYLVPLASSFIIDEKERSLFYEQTRAKSQTRETPVLRIHDNVDNEKKDVADVVRTRLRKNESVAILLPKRAQISSMYNSLTAAGIEAETQTKLGPDLDFTTDNPKLLTYHSAKGLTFDCVILPRLVNSVFKHESEEERKRLIFVGITRATQWVFMSTVDGQILTEIEPLMFMPENGLTVQIGAPDETENSGHVGLDDLI